MDEQLNHIKELVNSRTTRNAQIITITSGKGGVGKSNISVNLAIAIAQKGKKVVLVDADTNLANIDILLGLSPKYNFLNYVLDDIPIQKILTEHKSGISFIANSSGNRHWYELKDNLKHKIFELFMKLKKDYEYIIIDTSGGLVPLSLDIAVHSDKVLLVATSEPTAINDSYAMIKILNSMKKDIAIELLLNMVTSPSEVTDVFQRLSLVLDHFLNTGIGIAGYIIMDNNVRQAVNQQAPFLLQFPESIASKNIQNIAEILLENEPVFLMDKDH